ncbi:NuoM family protein [Chloroflexota bacterium]
MGFLEDIHILSLIVFLPALGAIVIALMRQSGLQSIRWIALFFTLATFAFSVALFAFFDRNDSGVQFTEKYEWISQMGVNYFLGVDGINLPMVIMTTFLGFIAVLVSWKIDIRKKEYFAYLLLLQSSILGVFLSLDLVMFLIFWEIEIIPMYFLISIWGHGRKDYSAIKYVLYTMFGGALLVAGALVLYYVAGPHMDGESAFDMIALRDVGLGSIPYLGVAFALLLVGFAVKLPVVPLHTWLPDAHTDAPTAVSVMLAGSLLKMGGYGMIRLCVSIFPGYATDAAPIIIVFAVIGVIYGAACTLRQTDVKRLVAYSSVSHMGYVLLGIFALSQLSVTGATLQMFAHGVISGLLFAMCGIIYDKAHTRNIPSLGGLARRMPVIAVLFTVGGLAALGLPGTVGFAGEFVTFLGAFASNTVSGIEIYTIIAISGVVLSAGYILWMIERVFYREPKAEWDHVKDADTVEKISTVALIAVIMLVGVYPKILTDVIDVGVSAIDVLTPLS